MPAGEQLCAQIRILSLSYDTQMVRHGAQRALMYDLYCFDHAPADCSAVCEDSSPECRGDGQNVNCIGAGRLKRKELAGKRSHKTSSTSLLIHLQIVTRQAACSGMLVHHSVRMIAYLSFLPTVTNRQTAKHDMNTTWPADAYDKQQGSRHNSSQLTASSTAHIVEQRLNAGDEHLILASQGLWNVITPDDAALRLHFHLKVSLSHQYKIYVGNELMPIYLQ